MDTSSEEGLEHNFWPSVPEIMKEQAFVSRGPCGTSGFSSVRYGIYLRAVFLKFCSSKQQSFHMLSEKGGTKITGLGEKSVTFLHCVTKPKNLGKSLKLSALTSFRENGVGR